MTNPELVTAHDLAQWATTLTSKSTVPRLVRRLILANTSVTQAAMRAGEGTPLRGWDGLVEAGVADAHVPQGTSRWEIGAGQDPRRKAQSDYRKRTANPLGANPATTTFVFLTPRSWPGRDAWCEARKRKGPWADVRAYDADDLATWLERAPSVHVLASEILGREPRDVRTPDAWWPTWSRRTILALPRSFLLAGRETASSALREALTATPPPAISLVAPSRDEAVAVLCAASSAPPRKSTTSRHER